MAKKRVALLGAGSISTFHVSALRAAGFEVAAVAARPGSKRLDELARVFAIPHVVLESAELVERAGEFDALVIASRVEATFGLLKHAIKSGRPVLVEKPVSTSASELRGLRDSTAPVIVGYNRRFYASTRFARRFAQANGPLLGVLEMPEQAGPPPLGLRSFFTNSVHGLDLARFVLGDLRVTRRSQIGTTATAVCAEMESKRGDLIQFVGNWRSPANFAFQLNAGPQRVDLRPFEEATRYEGMDVVEPTPANPIRTYRPRAVEQIPLEPHDRDFKPGFLAQAQALHALVRGQKDPSAATLRDAWEAVTLAEAIAGAPLRDLQ